MEYCAVSIQHTVPTKKITALTGYRAIAAIAVYLHHFNPSKEGLLKDFFHELHIGVTMFFTLSGFLLYYRYHHIAFTKRELIKYFRNRFARIFPVYLFLLAIHAVLHHWSIANFAFQASLLKGLIEPLKFSGIPQAWSLTVEEMFYASLPAIIALHKRGRTILAVALPILISLIGILLIGAAMSELPSFRFVALYTFPGRIAEFLIGAYFANQLISQRETPLTNKPLWRTGLLFAGLMCTMMWFRGDEPFGLYSIPGILINNFLLPLLVFGPLLLHLSSAKSHVKNLLSTKLLYHLGLYSYVFYLIHMGPIHNALHLKHPIIVFFVLWATSGFLYHTIEKPLNKFIRTL